MAKPPSIPPQRALVDARTRTAQAQTARKPRGRGKVQKGRPKGQKSVGVVRLFLSGLAFIGLATFAAPTCVLMLVGMVPSIVAYVVDREERPTLAFTIAPLNLAGLMPYLLQLWTGRDTMPTVVHLLTDVYVWLVIYLAAGVGWLLYLGMPTIVAVVLERSLNSRRARLRQVQEKLRTDWGAEVAGGRDGGASPA
jgi:hypothetical protein